MRRLVIVLALVLAPAVAAAQAAPPGSPEGAYASAEASGLSDTEKIEKAREHVAKMREVLSQVLRKLEEARESKDVIKLNCVNEKLTQVKGLLKISESASIALEEAAAKREADAAEHEYTKIVIARQKVDQLRTESEECIGEVIVGLDDEDTVIEVEEPADLPGVDPTRPVPPPPTVVRPPPASPTE